MIKNTSKTTTIFISLLPLFYFFILMLITSSMVPSTVVSNNLTISTFMLSIVFIPLSILWILANLLFNSNKVIYYIIIAISALIFILIITVNFTNIFFPDFAEGKKALLEINNPDIKRFLSSFHLNTCYYALHGLNFGDSKDIISSILLGIHPLFTTIFSIKEIKK